MPCGLHSHIVKDIYWIVPDDNWGANRGRFRFAVVIGLRSLSEHLLVFAHRSTLTGDVPLVWTASLASTFVVREVLPRRCQVDRANHLCGGIDCMFIGVVMPARLVERGLCGKSRHIHGIHFTSPFLVSPYAQIIAGR